MPNTYSSAFKRDDSDISSPSKSEILAIRVYQHINNSRLVVGLAIIIGLTAISVTFNYIVGEWTANDPESKALLPKGYALLDIALLFLCLMLAIGIHQPLLRWCSRIWCGVLLALSLWACAAFTIAVDAINDSEGTDQRIQQLEQNLASAKEKVGIWQSKLKNTSRHSSSFNSKLREAEKQRDYYQNQIAKLKHDTPPPALVIFDRLEHLIPGTIDQNTFQFYIRLIWGAALIITPLLCMSVTASEIRRLLLSNPPKKSTQYSTTPLHPVELRVGNTKHKSVGAERSTPGVPIQRSIAEEQYQHIKQAVILGKLRPSHAEIKKQCSSDLATEYQRRMSEEGVIVKTSRGYILSKHSDNAA